jgi:hypothetical protein
MGLDLEKIHTHKKDRCSTEILLMFQKWVMWLFNALTND